jgi:hypothetical protein
MPQFLAVVSGFLLGSALTYAWLSRQDRSSSKTLPEDEPSSTSRSIATPSRQAGPTAHLRTDGLLTDLVRELWSYINVAGCDTIRSTVEPMFVTLPGPLKTLRFTKIDLGSVPIRMDNLVVHEVHNDSVTVAMDVVWDGNCDMQLKADYIGSFGVKAIKLKGRLSLLLKPCVNALPPFSAIQYAFVTPPQVEIDFTGLAQVADFAVLDKRIRAIIQDSFACVTLPSRMMYKTDPACDYLRTYQPPLGVARITVVRGRGFHVEKRSLRAHDVPDVFCQVSINASQPFTTRTVKDSLEPVWEESCDFIVMDLDQHVILNAWDEDNGALDANDDLGTAKVSVGDLLLAGKTKEVELLEGNLKRTGAFVTLHCELLPWTSGESFEGLPKAPTESTNTANSLAGLMTVVVVKASNLPLAKKEDAASFVKVKYGAAFEFLTSVVLPCPGLDALNPVFDEVTFIPLPQALVDDKNDVVLELWNGQAILGSVNITHQSLLDMDDHVRTENLLVGDKGAKLFFRVSLQGVAEAPIGIPTVSAIEPMGKDDSEDPGTAAALVGGTLGKVSVTAVRGWGFVVEKRRFKKSDVPDVYCNIQFGSSPTVWRTKTVRNSTTPTWNESSTYPLSDHSQILHLNVFDEDGGARDTDDALGSARVAVGKILLAGGSMDVELLRTGKPTGCYIQVRCALVD